MYAFTLANALFDCERGHARAYHIAEDGARHDYVTLGFIAPIPEQAMERYCEELRRIRASLPKQPRPKLYWRLIPVIERGESPTRWKLHSRLAIPGIDWSQFTTKPEGLPFPQVK